MARPPMADPAGKWSLRQVAAHAGVSHASARRVVELGWVDGKNLTAQDVQFMRCAVTILDAPVGPGEDRRGTTPQAVARNTEAIRLIRALIDKPDPQATLILSPDTAQLTDPYEIARVVAHTTDPLVIVPVGSWLTRPASPVPVEVAQ